MGSAKRIKLIERQLGEMRDLCEQADFTNPDVSHWSVGEHLEHLALAADGIYTFFEKEALEPTIGKERLTLLGRIVFFFGRVKRGVGKAPKQVVPKKQDKAWLRETIESLIQKYSQLKGRVAEIDSSSAVYPHPYFGELSLKRWLHFICIHQDHHLRIVHDMRK